MAPRLACFHTSARVGMVTALGSSLMPSPSFLRSVKRGLAQHAEQISAFRLFTLLLVTVLSCKPLGKTKTRLPLQPDYVCLGRVCVPTLVSSTVVPHIPTNNASRHL